MIGWMSLGISSMTFLCATRLWRLFLIFWMFQNPPDHERADRGVELI
jgi:hypothetical protein